VIVMLSPLAARAPGDVTLSM